MEVNQPLPSNEELLVSSDTLSSKCIQYGMNAITEQAAYQVVRLTPESYHSAEAVNDRALSCQATVLKLLLYALRFL